MTTQPNFHMKKLILILLLVATQANGQGVGMRPEDIEKYKNHPSMTRLTKAGGMDLSTGVGVLPKKYSLKKYCPPSQDQIGNSCTAWAVGYYAHTILEAIQNQQEEPSYKDAFSPTWIYEQISKSNSGKCEETTNIVDALELLKNSGDVKIDNLPYDCDGNITENHKEIAKQFKIQGSQAVFTDFDESNRIDKNLKLGQVKLAISNNSPVIIAWEYTTSFQDGITKQKIWQRPTTEKRSDKPSLHAMTVVAYNDDMQAFQLANSWGNTWADNGFIWVSYEDFYEFTYFAFQAIPLKSGSPAPRNISFNAQFNTSQTAEIMPIIRKPNTGTGRGVDTKKKEFSDRKSDDFAQYRFENDYSSGTQFQFTCTIKESMYVYVIATDKKNIVNKIFPLDKEKTENIEQSPLIPYQNSAFIYPSPEHYAYLDNNVGLEYFCFLLSPEELDFDELIATIKLANGSFYQKIKTTLGNRLINPIAASYENDKIAVTMPFGNNSDSILPIFVELNHVK